MAIFKSGNPALNANTFANATFAKDQTEVMTISGTINKIFVLLLLVIVSSVISWRLIGRITNPSLVYMSILGGIIISFVLAIIIIRNKENAGTLSPVYAIFEGLTLGAISAIFDSYFPGIVVQAILLTFGILISILIIFKLRIIKVTENFKMIVAAATGGIALYYIISLVMSFWGGGLPFIHSNGIGGIIFSLFVVAIASMNLVVDFDFIEKGAENKAPKYMEWYGAFGLLVTLVWLYLEILRLLAKLRSR